MGRWDPQLHPRGPGGRFVKKGAVGQVAKALTKDTGGGGSDWAKRVSDKAGHVKPTLLHYNHVRGTDQTGWLVENAPRLSALWDKQRNNVGFGPKYGDPIMEHTAAQQGWDALPRQGTAAELDAAIKAGGVEIHRGVTAGVNTGPESAKMLEQLRQGELRYGTGIYGQGIYFSPDRKAALAFGSNTKRGNRWVTDPQSMQRAVLSPDAKILTYGSPEADRLVGRVGTAFDFHHGSDRGRQHRNRISDLGRAALAAGYDAIRVPAGLSDGSQQNAEQYNVLNRTALLFEKPAPPKVRR